MKKWKNYSLKKKVTLGLLMLMLAMATPALAIYMPELLFIIDFGGLELAVGFVLVYFKPVVSKCIQLFYFFRDSFQLIYMNILNSSLVNPKVLFYHQVLSLIIMFVSGSLILSLILFAPTIYIGGI